MNIPLIQKEINTWEILNFFLIFTAGGLTALASFDLIFIWLAVAEIIFSFFYVYSKIEENRKYLEKGVEDE